MERNFDFCSEMLTSGGFARRTDGGIRPER